MTHHKEETHGLHLAKKETRTSNLASVLAKEPSTEAHASLLHAVPMQKLYRNADHET